MTLNFFDVTYNALTKRNALCQIIHDGILRLEKSARLRSVRNFPNKLLT